MSAEEKYLIALGNLQSMAIDNTKGSKAVEICVNDIRDYLDKYKQVIDKIKEILKDPDRDGFDDDGYDDSYYDMIYTERIKELLEEIE